MTTRSEIGTWEQIVAWEKSIAEAEERGVSRRPPLQQPRQQLGGDHAENSTVSAETQNGITTRHSGHGIDDRKTVATFPEGPGPFVDRR